MTHTIQIPKPSDLGFDPKKFSQWRKNQTAAIRDALESDKRFVGQVMTLGAGKSLCYMAQAVLSKSRTMVLTSTKGLQTQLEADFGNLGLTDIRGKGNYDCTGIPGKKCDDGTIGKCHYKGSSNCTWVAARQLACEASMVTTNYSCWTSTNKYGSGFGAFDMLIMDEAHSAEDALTRAMKITLSQHEVTEMLKYAWPDEPLTDDLEGWKDWAVIAKHRCLIRIQELKDKIACTSHPSDSLIRNYKSFVGLKMKLANVATCKPEKWVVDNWGFGDGYQFDPIYASEFGEQVLFRGIRKVILTSGTIRPRTLESLGIPSDEFDFFEYPRDIVVSKSPLYYIPTAYINRRTDESGYQALINRIDEIIESRADRRIIIHTGNFKIRDYIIEHSRYTNYMISNYVDGGDATSAIIERFKESKPPTILVSPSVTTGYDFPGSDCRCQIIAKLPFPDYHTSKVERERDKLDPERGISHMWTALSQAFGLSLIHI